MALTVVTYFVDEHDRIYNAPTSLTFLSRDEAVQWAIDNDPVYNIVSVVEQGVGAIPPPWSTPQSFLDHDDVFFPQDVIIGGDLTGGNVANLIPNPPEEILLTPSGEDDVEISLGDSIARHAFMHDAVGEYYVNGIGARTAQALTLDQLVMVPVWLTKGTIDQLGIDVSTQATAGGVVRAGFATNNAGLPHTPIAEATIDSTVTGFRSAAPGTALVIPQNGKYWAFVVSQVAACSINGPSAPNTNHLPLPLGTTGPSGTAAWFSRIKASISGAVPSPITGINPNPQSVRLGLFWRYSSIGD